MPKVLWVSGLLSLALIALACATLPNTGEPTGGAVEQTTQKISKLGLTLAPELQGEIWLNGAPTSFKALRGQVVLIDFWTFG